MTIAQLRLAFALAPSCILLTMPLLISRRPILQQVRGHTLTCAPTDSQITVSCSISLPYRGSLSPFPRGTISLSVIQEYLALRGGPRRFTRDFTCPMLLGIEKSVEIFSTTGLSPSLVQDSAVSFNFHFIFWFLPTTPVYYAGLGWSLFARRY